MNSKPRLPTDKIISRLRLMASAGGMLTRDRLKLLTQAADRLEEYAQRKEGDTDEEH